MERKSKGELLQIIEQKDVVINKYKSKLKDLVSAYKGLDKEKSALEASLKVLTASRDKKETKPEQEKKEIRSEQEDETRSEDGAAEQSDTSTEVIESETTPTTDSQLATLSEALATLTQEHAKLKTSYISDKKQLKLEYSELQRVAEEREAELNRQIQSLQAVETQLRERLSGEQTSREREQNDQAALMHELQKLLSTERIQKEFFEDKVHEVEAELKQTKKKQNSDDAEKYRKQIQDLHNELQLVRSRLQSAEHKASIPDPMIAKLQHEISEMKIHYRRSVSEERRRAELAETEASTTAVGGEQRISSLEERLAELSQVVGSYERLREQDLQAMAKLKERITHLDLENSALTRLAHSTQSEALEESDVEAVMQRMRKLQEVLVQNGEHHRIKELVEELDSGESLHGRCREELETLKEEFERYKLRASAVLKSKSGKDSQLAETESLRLQLQQLTDRSRDQLKQLENQKSDIQTQHDSLRAQLAKTQADLSAGNEREETLRRQMSALDAEMSRVRSRTTTLLAEKEQELAALRTRLGTHRQLSTDSTQLATDELLMRREPSESGLLHYETELARLKLELTTHRQKKHELELRLRDTETETNEERRRLTEQLQLCKQELRRAERSRTEDGCGLEYIKNIVLQYMVCADVVGKERIANVISTVLEFSPDERTEVAAFNKSWWASQKFHSSRR